VASGDEHANPRRGWLLAGLAGLVVVLGVVPILAAPGVPATCSKVLELARLAGEPVEPSDREQCEAYYERQRARRGPLGWARLSWCIRGVRSIPEAGAC
jgi:hypothetical protein